MRALAPAILALGAVLALGTHASAKCAYAAAYAIPADGPLPTNGRILFEVFGAARPALDSLPSLSPRLVAGTDVVPLVVVAKHDGDFAVRQAVLAPSRPLHAGATYTFRVDPLPSGVTVDAVDYVVGMGADAKAPTWSGPPTVSGSHWRRLGCGPEAHVDLRVPATDDVGPLYVEAEVRSGPRTTTYVVSVKGGVASLGHGMCSGPFEMMPSTTYTVVLRALDAAGHATPMPGPPLVIAAPINAPTP